MTWIIERLAMFALDVGTGILLQILLIYIVLLVLSVSYYTLLIGKALMRRQDDVGEP